VENAKKIQATGKLGRIPERWEVCFLDGNERNERLQQLQQLQRLQALEQLAALKITCGSYEDVRLEPDSVIYCDIPYLGTAKYKIGADADGFNYEKFYRWGHEQQVPVFVSEYAADLQKLYEKKHRSTLSATNNAKVTVENLYGNALAVSVANYAMIQEMIFDE
jgi:site-specific DNA-adenine methylase